MTIAMEVKGRRLLVKPDEINTKIGSFEIAVDRKMERAGQHRGTVVSIGSLCWKGFEDETPWCQVGDWVQYVRYAGQTVEDPVTKEEYHVMNDEDLVAVLYRP
jgi:co-chaperonin GroES (HSP10)